MDRQPKTQDEERKMAFDAIAEHARHLGETSLREIDRVLLEQERFRESLQGPDMTPEEVDQMLAGYAEASFPKDVHTSPRFYL